MSTLHVENLKGLSSGSNANKIIIPSGQTLQASGHVIQVANNTGSTGSTSTSSGAYLTTPYTATITPKFATSKILAMFSFSILLRATGSPNAAALGFSLLRNTTRLTTSATNTHELFISTAGILMANRQHYEYLDSPSTTSATTYKLEAYPRYSGQTTEFDSRRSTWSMTLWEIAQ